MPRHHAERMVSPDIGNMMATRTTVRSRVGPENPGAAKAVTAGASNTPTTAPMAVVRVRGGPGGVGAGSCAEVVAEDPSRADPETPGDENAAGAPARVGARRRGHVGYV